MSLVNIVVVLVVVNAVVVIVLFASRPNFRLFVCGNVVVAVVITVVFA